MQSQVAQISNLKSEIKKLEEENFEQISLKEAEITTIRSYFEKSEENLEKLQKQIDLKNSNISKLQQEHDLLKEELDKFKQEKNNSQQLNKQIDGLKKEVIDLNEILGNERESYLLEIENRFKRCLEILQIHDVAGLSAFFKTAPTEKKTDEDMDEYLAMKFNTTKSESDLFLKKVLCLEGKYTKVDMIERFIERIGKGILKLDSTNIS